MTDDLERFTPDLRGLIAYEHRHRYAFCRGLVAGKDVLDVACGEGYGSDLLATAARSVVGLDIDVPTVERAREKYREKTNLKVMAGDCAALPFADASFDVVVSFETIEHIADQAQFVAESARVVRKGGLFVVSTPNRPVYSEETGLVNPFHVKEFDEAEFRDLLSNQFRSVQLFGQRFVVPSLIAPVENQEGQEQDLHGLVARDASHARRGVADYGHFQYFIAICSQHPVRSKPETPSVFLDQNDDLWREHRRILSWASGLHREDELLRARLKQSEDDLERLRQTPPECGVLDEIKELTVSTRDLVQNEIVQSLTRLANEHADWWNEMERARRQSEELRCSLDEVKSAFSQSEGRVAQLERELSERDAQLHQLRRAGDESRQALDDMREQGRQKDERLAEISRELLTATQQLQASREEVAEAKRSVQGAQQAIQQSEERAAELAERIAVVAEEKESCERALVKLESSLNESRAGRQRAEEYVLELSASLFAADEAANKARAELETALAAQALSLNAQFETSLQLSSEASAAREAEIARLGAQLAAARAECEDAAERNRILEADLESLGEEFGAKEAAALQLTREFESVEAELKRKADLLEGYGAAVQQLERQMRVVGAKRLIEAEFTNAVKQVRTRLAPLGLVVDNERLRSTIVRAEQRSLDRSERKEIQRSNLFDAAWYLERNPDVAERGVDPMEHYLRHGFMEDRDPHPLFSAAWYRALYAEELQGGSPLVHYLRNGQSMRRSPHPLFDPAFYLRRNQDIAESNLDPLTHYIDYGEMERRDPHPLVHVDRLLRQPGFEGVERPLTSYVTQPRLFLASPHPLFDADFYLYENNDVRREGICPLLHYCAVGWREGRQPHRAFAGDWYLQQNPDVLSEKMNPLAHFVQWGAFEDRSPHPLFDLPFYLRSYRDARTSPLDALTHYVTIGAADQRETTERLSVADMKAIVPDAYWRRFEPISAFVHFGDTRLSIPTLPVPGQSEVRKPLNVAWPPTPEPVYWLPQQLRDFIIERYGEAHIPLYLYLMSAVDRYGDHPDAFAQSPDFNILVDRLRHFSAGRRRARKVDVSIIIPVYNNLVFTLTSVLSLLENASRYTFEIIVADDRSSDSTEEVFSAARGPVVHVRHEKNLGFLGNCNAAAHHARGRYVVFLNNDTLTLPGWLDELIAPLETDDRIGLTGSKLINGDGSLQEAGGIFWRDGSAWNYGRNKDPRLPEFNYLKDADYISGASIALPTKVWESLSGFDPIYTPAYCEDSDIAFRVRAAGLRTVYTPHSAVVHHEGKSHGRDTSSGIKAYQVANQEKLLIRWRATLEQENFPNGENVFLARDRSRSRPHVLVVDHYIPQWDRDAGSRTVYHFLRMFLDAGFQVTFWPDNLYEDREYCARLQNAGVEVIYSAAYVGQFDAFMATNGAYFDYALVNRPHIAIKYYDSIRAHSRCPILYYGHDIHYKRLEHELQTSKDPGLVEKIKAFRAQESENWRKADIVLYPSDEERTEVRKTLPNGVAESVPMLGYRPEELNVAYANLENFGARDGNQLLFVGGSHPPNVDALLWFANEVMPLILAEQPTTRLNVVGSTNSPEISRLKSDSIIIKGRLSDEELAALYAHAGVAVIPLRFGGGVKGKTIEALFHSIPVVTTSVGMQGLFPEAPISYIGDSAEDFASAVMTAQRNRGDALANARRGVAFIEAHYSLDAMKRAFAPFVPQLAVSVERGERASAPLEQGVS